MRAFAVFFYGAWLVFYFHLLHTGARSRLGEGRRKRLFYVLELRISHRPKERRPSPFAIVSNTAPLQILYAGVLRLLLYPSWVWLIAWEKDMTATWRRTRFVCVSDTHNASPADGGFKLPRGDVLLHAGDLTNQGSLSELRKAVHWIEEADFEAKIVIAGSRSGY